MAPARSAVLVQAAHSVLEPAGPRPAGRPALDFMFWVAAVGVSVVIAALLCAAIRRRRAARARSTAAREDGMRRAVSWAAGLTVVILLVFLVSILGGRAARPRPAPRPSRSGHRAPVVVGRAVRRLVPQQRVTTANEIHIPVGRPVVFELLSNDVIHSFWIPNLSGKNDLIPGRHEQLWFEADTAGRLPRPVRRVLRPSAREDGALVVAEPPDDFERWLAQQRDTARPPRRLASRRRGQEVFVDGDLRDVPHHRRARRPAGESGPT